MPRNVSPFEVLTVTGSEIVGPQAARAAARHGIARNFDKFTDDILRHAQYRAVA
jgi:hypothetical protein